jgi:hypothetical protein
VGDEVSIDVSPKMNKNKLHFNNNGLSSFSYHLVFLHGHAFVCLVAFGTKEMLLGTYLFYLLHGWVAWETPVAQSLFPNPGKT